jgi:caspase domain-containing protein/YARHG domain-containing protein/SH3 domain-containing protein
MLKLSHCIVLLFYFTLFGLAPTSPATAANRAFIVGNGQYAHAQHLPNPGNDAKDIAAKLTALGYQVTLGLNLTRTGFLRKFQTFTQTLKSDDVALFYYAGHGLQLGGENYLFPVDVIVRNEEDAHAGLIQLNTLLADLSRRTSTRIVILDACRNNPFAPKIERSLNVRAGGLSQGLARVYAGVGSFIAYSTQPGNVALDGDGRNSPFTQALLQQLSASQTEVHAVMRRVRAFVQRTTGGKQVPWENSSLISEVAFDTAATPQPHTTSPAVMAANDAPPRASEITKRDTFHFVGGLDPKGDNFLALKSGPGVRYKRLATMGPNTPLKILETRGVWKRVALSDGATGWAHGNWIKCCKSFEHRINTASPKPANTPASAENACGNLWYTRNSIWHRYGYCFRGEKGQRVFGNDGCNRDQAQARAAMSGVDRNAVDAIAAQEKVMGCR